MLANFEVYDRTKDDTFHEYFLRFSGTASQYFGKPDGQYSTHRAFDAVSDELMYVARDFDSYSAISTSRTRELLTHFPPFRRELVLLELSTLSH